MEPSTIETGGYTGERANPHGKSRRSWDDERGEKHSRWILDDIEEPEVWTLSSFAELLPGDVA